MEGRRRGAAWADEAVADKHEALTEMFHKRVKPRQEAAAEAKVLDKKERSGWAGSGVDVAKVRQSKWDEWFDNMRHAPKGKSAWIRWAGSGVGGGFGPHPKNPFKKKRKRIVPYKDLYAANKSQPSATAHTKQTKTHRLWTAISHDK